MPSKFDANNGTFSKRPTLPMPTPMPAPTPASTPASTPARDPEFYSVQNGEQITDNQNMGEPTIGGQTTHGQTIGEPTIPQPDAPKRNGTTPKNAPKTVQQKLPTKLQKSSPQPMSKLPDLPSGKAYLEGASSSLFGLRWLRSWPIAVLIIFGALGTLGTTAVVSLFRIPSLPNCRAVFWPTASASLRLQCAETYAAEGDVKNLLAAIALVDQLPEDHPLRNDIINNRIEDWATEVLDLAERFFEEGDLEQAIASAQKIPARTAAAEVVEDRITRWQKIWQEGEEGFNSAVTKLKEKNFQSAFTLSVALLDVPNRFWSTTKYNELTKLIMAAREDSRKMSKALGFAKEGTIKGFTEALKKLKEIGEESVFYSEAQNERKKIAKQMLAVGEQLLADRKVSDAQAILSAIPRDTGLIKEIDDFQIFVTAYQQAWTGTLGGLENAIKRMQTLGKDRPSYAKGQRLIAQWQGELQNVALLRQASERAGRGSTADLTAAIGVANQVSRSSPQWEEASERIGQWQSRVETVQDRPILERADQLASRGSTDGLRAAIQEARKVGSRRALGKEADERIANWTERVQRIEDQPVLDQARQRARSGDVPGAIAVANRIGEGRSLYRMAQDEISEWQDQEDGRSRLNEAVNAASRGDGNSLANAIEIAQRVPGQSDSRRQADSQINRWSWDLLRQAETAAGRDLDSAIALAGRIPSQAEAYDPAQIRIGNWQETLRQVEASRRPPEPEPPRIPDIGESGVPADIELSSPERQ